MGAKAVFVTNALTLTATSVAATQSGAWIVGQSGAWNVGQIGTWTVTVDQITAFPLQGATSTGQRGPMNQGVVAAAPPSGFAGGEVRPLSLTLRGALRSTLLDQDGEIAKTSDRDVLLAILGRLDLLCRLYASGTQQALFAPPLSLN